MVSEELLEYYEDDPEEEDYDRDLVDAMHHFDVDIRRPGWVLFSEKIASYFTKGEEVPESALPICFFSFHVQSELVRASVRPRG